jgi:serine/threonine-protein kinase
MKIKPGSLALALLLCVGFLMSRCSGSTATDGAIETPTQSAQSTPTPSDSASDTSTETAPTESTPPDAIATGNVPDVVDLDEYLATAILEDAGFVVEIDYVDSDYEDDGIVLDQDPMGGDNADDGSTITLEVGAAE